MEINNDTTLIILDWDDTLFPTTWLHKNNINIFNNKKVLYDKFFKHLDLLLHKLFIKMIKYGTVIIITNALLNWIDITLTLLPNLEQLIKNKQIQIISARGEYSHVTKDPEIWKKIAFKNEVNKILEKKNINNIISMGDAEYEYYALINLYQNNEIDFKLLKSIKFIRYPSIIQIYKQIELSTQFIFEVCKEPEQLDLELKPMK
jgi:hypothetical protein